MSSLRSARDKPTAWRRDANVHTPSLQKVSPTAACVLLGPIGAAHRAGPATGAQRGRPRHQSRTRQVPPRADSTGEPAIEGVTGHRAIAFVLPPLLGEATRPARSGGLDRTRATG